MAIKTIQVAYEQELTTAKLIELMVGQFNYTKVLMDECIRRKGNIGDDSWDGLTSALDLSTQLATLVQDDHLQGAAEMFFGNNADEDDYMLTEFSIDGISVGVWQFCHLEERDD